MHSCSSPRCSTVLTAAQGIGLGFFTATDTGSSFIEPVHYAEIEIATGSILGKRQRVDEEDEDEDDLESLFSSPKRHRTTAPKPGSGLVPSYSYLINSIYTGRMEANVPDVVLSPLGTVGWPSRRYRRNPVVISPFAAPLADIDASTTQNSLLPGVGTFFDAADGMFEPFRIGQTSASPDLSQLAPLNF